MKTNGTIYFSSVKFKVLDFIKKFIDEHDYSPTFLEIGENFSFSRARAGKICSELYKMGLINKGGSSHRKIRMNPTQLKQVKKLKINREYSTHG
jgi:SOS-response transcriptional repressor LexA